MARFEPVVLERKPGLVLVYGDVNSTVAAALVCSKLQIKVGHVEAGLPPSTMSVQETALLDMVLFEPRVFEDARGYFLESYNEREMTEAASVNASFRTIIPIRSEMWSAGCTTRYVTRRANWCGLCWVKFLMLSWI